MKKYRSIFLQTAYYAILISLPTKSIAEQSSQQTLLNLINELKAEQNAISQKINAIEEQLKEHQNIATKTNSAATIISIDAHKDENNAIPKIDSNKKFDVTGDLQLRYEGNYGDKDQPARNRGVMRARLRTTYDVNDAVQIGAELSTGNSDDPNTVHVTLSDFVDDFEVSLSRLYATYDLGRPSFTAGKFANPFTRSDLVWDGDVNPQGVTVNAKLYKSETIKLSLDGIYFIVDEETAGPDSDMLGGQINFANQFGQNWRVTAAASYYDYSLDDLSSAGPGDFRSNLRTTNGGYASDFNLLNLLASVQYLGFGERWPVKLSADFVKNYGASTDEDQGLHTSLSLGRLSNPMDWRLAYGYSQAEIDAVLGAFSNDNLSIATNYQSHQLTIDYLLDASIALNATLFHYKPLNAHYSVLNDPNDWLNRFRLNVTLSF